MFCDSRSTVEELGAAATRERASPRSCRTRRCRRRAPAGRAAFAEARDCVIVVDLHAGARHRRRRPRPRHPDRRAAHRRLVPAAARAHRPPTRATRNCLFLALDERLAAAGGGAARCCGARGWVEPVVAPPEPRHIVAQQLLALCLQEHQVGDRLWPEWWNGLAPFDRERRADRRAPASRGLPRAGRRAAVHRPGGRASASAAGTSWT